MIKDTAPKSKPYWQPRVDPGKSAPNVLLIMTDDAGFGVPGTFGGVIPTPALDRIAASGLRYTNFHSTALCSPTRAAIITGRNHHSAGFGVIAEQATGFPGYDSIITRDKATIGRILKDNGYRTAWFGKDHNTPSFEGSQAGPFDQWPAGMGFEYFYGFIGGDTNQWEPNLFRNTTQIYPFTGKPGWNLITGMADDAIEYMNRMNAIAPDQPFFVYYVPGGTHAPHHPTPEWIKKVSDMHLFDQGWNKLRETDLRQPEEARRHPPGLQADSLAEGAPQGVGPADGRREEAVRPASGRVRRLRRLHRQRDWPRHPGGRRHGQAGQHPHHLHRGRQRDERRGNGGRHSERDGNVQRGHVPVEAQLKYFYDVWGSDKTYPHMAVGWSWAFDTPFPWTKQIASHLGGIRQGMAISWPKVIKDKGGIRNQFHHVIDVVPTILEATGVKPPKVVDGIKQSPIEGVSMAYTFDAKNAKAPSTHKTQYFEMFGDRALYHEGWMASTKVERPPWHVTGPTKDPMAFSWELYDLNTDWTQSTDVAAKYPAKLKELRALFMTEAKKYQVLPLDTSVGHGHHQRAAEHHRRARTCSPGPGR